MWKKKKDFEIEPAVYIYILNHKEQDVKDYNIKHPEAKILNIWKCQSFKLWPKAYRNMIIICHRLRKEKKKDKQTNRHKN